LSKQKTTRVTSCTILLREDYYLRRSGTVGLLVSKNVHVPVAYLGFCEGDGSERQRREVRGAGDSVEGGIWGRGVPSHREGYGQGAVPLPEFV